MTNVLPQRVPSARRYWLRLLLLIPALAMLGAGLYSHYTGDPGVIIDGIKLRTKEGLVGQASEAVANVNPSNPDLYLRVYQPGERGAELFPKRMPELIK